MVGILVAAAAAAYLVARAAYVPLTYDEASSYHRYIANERAALFDFASATNHLLNSVLTRLSHAAFGAAPWALRLPNVLAGCGFLACAVAFAMRMRNAVIGAAGAVLLATNPYLLDYFSLSRGYGLAIALITGSTYFLVRWCDEPLASAAHRTRLVACLGLAGAAVAANYSVLPACLAVAAIVVVRLVWAARLQGRPDAGGPPVMWSWWRLVAWVLVAAAFTATVFARERVSSENEFLPVTVRVAGLFEDELAAIRVFRADSTGRLRELSRRPGGVWISGPVQDAWTLRIVLPVFADRNLASLDVTMGAEVYRRDRRTPGPWRVEDVGSARVLMTTDVVKWRGDADHRRLVVAHIATTLAALAALAAGLIVVSRVLTRARLVRPEDARIVVAAVIGVASVAAAPLYLLQRDGQLFFGGTSGLVADTFGSLVTGTAYGGQYHPAQTSVALLVFGLVAAGFLFAFTLVSRTRCDAAFQSAAAVLGVFALAVVQAAVQHRLLETPYPLGRTALALVPLALVFLVMSADALATLGRPARVIATRVMLLLAAGSAWNGARAANLSRTLDWPSDSATPEMLRLVAESDAAERAVPRMVRVGVEWMYYPVARYYAERQSTGTTRYEVIVLPGDGLPFDFVYASSASDPMRGVVVQRFPESDAVLTRVAP